jgi:hypothetical protein
MNLDHKKKSTPIYAKESVELDKDYISSLHHIQSFRLAGNGQIVRSPVVLTIKPRNHSNTIMISVELEGPEPFPDSENICVTGEPLHVAYI